MGEKYSQFYYIILIFNIPNSSKHTFQSTFPEFACSSVIDLTNFMLEETWKTSTFLHFVPNHILILAFKTMVIILLVKHTFLNFGVFCFSRVQKNSLLIVAASWMRKRFHQGFKRQIYMALTLLYFILVFVTSITLYPFNMTLNCKFYEHLFSYFTKIGK